MAVFQGVAWMPPKGVLKMTRVLAILCTLIVAASLVTAKPTSNVNRQKRQSDQRLAELETLLALQKYNGHRVRGWPSHNDLSPGFGLIDFEKIGRRKKSTRFSPGYAAFQETKNNNNMMNKNNLLPLPPTWLSGMSALGAMRNMDMEAGANKQSMPDEKK